MTHVMPQLAYGLDALSPYMSKETLEFHYGKHLQTYVDNLNKLIPELLTKICLWKKSCKKAEGGIFNNAAQAWNHTFFLSEFNSRTV